MKKLDVYTDSQNRYHWQCSRGHMTEEFALQHHGKMISQGGGGGAALDVILTYSLEYVYFDI